MKTRQTEFNERWTLRAWILCAVVIVFDLLALVFK